MRVPKGVRMFNQNLQALQQAANFGAMGAIGGAVPPAPPEGIGQRIIGTLSVAEECHKIIAEIENSLGVALAPQEAAAQMNVPGVNGSTLALRNSLIGLRERLGNIATQVR